MQRPNWRLAYRGFGSKYGSGPRDPGPAVTPEVLAEGESQTLPHLEPRTYPPGTILTTAQLATWLQVSSRQVELMRLPRLSGLGRLARYEAGTVLDHLLAPPDPPPTPVNAPRRRR